MKSTFIKIFAAMLAIMMCAALVACGGGKDEPVATTTTAGTTAAEVTTTTTKAPETTTTTKAPETTTTTTEATTEDPTIIKVPAEGLIVYYEDFDALADNTDSNDVIAKLGWKRLTKEDNGVYNEGDAYFAIEKGRLLIRNYFPDDADKVGPNGAPMAKDGYYLIEALTDDIMMNVCAGKYTLQYEVEYIETAKDYGRYLNFITEFNATEDCQCYNSFHFRNGGYANNQCHFYGSWYTYDAYDATTNAYCASQNDTETSTTGPSICMKLLGKAIEKPVNAFSEVPVVIRVQHDPDVGQTVYMRLTTSTDWTLITQPSDSAAGGVYWGAWDGWSVAFKLGAGQNGYIDNVVLWTGWGDQPAGKTVTYKG